jgi:hypothetical protein
MNDVCERAAARVTAAQLRLGETMPGVHLLLMLCDVILDPTVTTVATNGAELLVHPHHAATATLEDLEVSLLVAVLDAAYLHPLLPEGIRQADWCHRTAPRIQEALAALDLGATGGVCWHDRLRTAAPGVDLAQRWGRRRCWARQFSGMATDRSLELAGLELVGDCLVCAQRGHLPYVHPQFDRILRGAPDAPGSVPALAEACFGAVWGLTSPILPREEHQRGLAWLERCGAAAWAHLARRRLRS